SEDLNARTDDEDHEEQVEKVLQPEPRRKARVHGRRGCRDAWVTRKEILYGGDGPQLLRDGDPKNHHNKCKRHHPQYIDPSLANTDVRHNAFPRRQPSAQAEAIVRAAETHLKRIAWWLIFTNIRHDGSNQSSE
ncbi:MAG: hypothetical protein ABI618_08500, partial [Nitrospirota bacterium]